MKLSFLAKTKSELIKKYFKDIRFRAFTSLLLSLSTCVLNILFRLVIAIIYFSSWFFTIAIYYFMLAFIRLFLLKNGYSSVLLQQGDYKEEIRISKIAGLLMLVLNLIIFILVNFILRENMSYSYPGYIIYVSALYLFVSVGFSIRNIFTYRKTNSPVIITSKALRLTESMFSILTLQTAMLTTFSSESEQGFIKIMNTITGLCVTFITLAISIGVIYTTSKKRDLDSN